MKNLIQLFLNNSQKPRNTRIVNSEGEATIYLYDLIGDDWYGGVSAKDFVQDLAGLDVNTIHLRINSPGGDVFAGRSMATALRQHKAKVVAHIDGLAASAASFIAMAADEIEIATGAFIMIHNGWTLAMGDKHTMTDTANLLEKVDQSIIADYVARTGKSADDIRAMMDAETWLSDQEAVDGGFADRVAETKASAENAWNLSAYNNAPKALTEKPAEPEPVYDRAALHRKLTLLETISP